MRVNKAILHVFDFASCVNVFAQTEMDLGDKVAKRYVASQARKAANSLDSCRGSFTEDSAFAEELRAYFHGRRSFVGLSQQIGEFLAGELSHADKAPSCDLLVVDFEGDADREVLETAVGAIPGGAPVGANDETAPWDEGDGFEPSMADGLELPVEMTDAEAHALRDAQAAYEAKGPRYLGIILLESRPAFMHEERMGDAGETVTTISRHQAILPNPSQKVASFALVEAETLAVWFCDKEREIAGEKRMVIPDGLLQCTKQASSKEVLRTVTAVVEEVAQEFGANTAKAIAKAKSYVAENADDTGAIDASDLGREVFEDEPVCQERFARAVEEGDVPQQVVVEKAVAKRVAKSHKIRTDTGIELTFPAEYGENPDFIEFFNTPDGRIEIALKNIGSIENR